MQQQGNYQLLSQIGKGSFGLVYKAINVNTKEICALKRLEKAKIDSNPYLKSAFLKEMEIMKRCQSKYSVKLFDVVQSLHYYNISMELCDTDLQFILNNRQNGFSTEEIRKIMSQLNEVFLIMYKEHIMHRDLKLQNIFIKYTNEAHTEFAPKLGDFGFSKVIENDVTATSLGTPITMAPEVLDKRPYSYKADLWSLGVIIYQLLFKAYPFFGLSPQSVLKQIRTKPLQKLPQDPLLKDLLCRLLTVDVNKRISWEDYFMHPFFGNCQSIYINDYQVIEKFKWIGEIRNEQNTHGIENVQVYVCNDKSRGGKKVFMKKYKNAFKNNYFSAYDKEVSIFKTFQGCNYVLKYVNDFNDNDYSYIIFDYIENTMPLNDYLNNLKNNLTEEDISRINKSLFTNVFFFAEKNHITFDVLTTYNFIIDVKKLNVYLFDCGLCRHLLPKDIVSSYYIDSTQVNDISIKSNVMNYGITLFKMFYNNYSLNVSKEDKKLKLPTLPNNKKMGKNLNFFISKCIYRDPNRRYNWRDISNSEYINKINNGSNNANPILTEDRLKIIFDWIEYKYSLFVKYYSNFDFKNSKNREVLYEITQILTALWIELKTVIKIFNKQVGQHQNFFNEEISFIRIFQDGSYKFLKLDLEYLARNQLVFNKSLSIIPIFIEKLKEIQKKIIGILLRFLKEQNMKIQEINSEEFLRNLLFNMGTMKIQAYFNSLIEEGLKLFNQNKIEESNLKTSIGIFICEYNIMIRLLELKKKDNSNNFNLIGEYFQDGYESSQMSLSVIHLNEIKEGYVFISFISGLFSYYFKNVNYSDQVIEEREKTLTTLINLYPEIMTFIVDIKKKINP